MTRAQGRAELDISYEDDPRVVREAATEDYSMHVVPRSWRSGRLSLSMTWAALFSAMFWLVVAASVARTVGTRDALIGIALAVLTHGGVNFVLSRYANRTGLTVALMSRRLFGYFGAALAPLIFAATAIYYAVFEGSVVAVALEHYFGGLALRWWYLIVVLYSIPLVFGGVRVWLDKFNGVLLPFYVLGLVGAVAWAGSQYGFSADWLHAVPSQPVQVAGPGWVFGTAAFDDSTSREAVERYVATIRHDAPYTRGGSNIDYIVENSSLSGPEELYSTVTGVSCPGGPRSRGSSPACRSYSRCIPARSCSPPSTTRRGPGPRRARSASGAREPGGNDINGHRIGARTAREAIVSHEIIRRSPDEHALEVLDAGIQTTVQDWPGRRGMRPRGFFPSGPMDHFAARVANVLVGNAGGAAVLEIPVGRFSARVGAPGLVALCGAEGATPSLNGIEVPLWESFEVCPGDLVSCSRAKGPGFRLNLAFSGGFAVPEVFGSRSTHLVAGVGGIDGRALIRGDVLTTGTPKARAIRRARLPQSLRPTYPEHWEIDVMRGPHTDPEFVTEQDWADFVSAAWRVSMNSDRSATRLNTHHFQWSRTDGGAAGGHPSNVPDFSYPLDD
ncbi:hypothetical protein [Saccharopolyspora hattusasensis]|uniref:hypothetical protein n=1 Tax=Saccharopolyspora hattusasensis TaxID=1128679 RepID=UPI003D994472